MESLAAETRAAVDARPFVRDALRAGILNYAAAARYLDVEGDVEAIATALRRYKEDLPPYDTADRDLRVRMESDFDRDLLVVDGETPDLADRRVTAITMLGPIDATFMGSVLSRLAIADVTVAGAGFSDRGGVILVDRRGAARALRLIEDVVAGI
jgi:hypothetical protein